MGEFTTVGLEEVAQKFLRMEEAATKAVPLMLEAGANVIVAGSGIFKGDPGEKTRRLLQMMDEFERQKQ